MSLLDCKEIKSVNPKGNQSWIFFGRTDADAPILWPPDGKSWLSKKDPDAGKDWRQEEKGTTENKMVRWHHRLNGHVFEQAPGDGDGQGGLVCCSPWGRQESDMTERLNNEYFAATKDCNSSICSNMERWLLYSGSQKSLHSISQYLFLKLHLYTHTYTYKYIYLLTCRERV